MSFDRFPKTFVGFYVVSQVDGAARPDDDIYQAHQYDTLVRDVAGGEFDRHAEVGKPIRRVFDIDFTRDERPIRDISKDVASAAFKIICNTYEEGQYIDPFIYEHVKDVDAVLREAVHERDFEDGCVRRERAGAWR